MVKHQRLKFPFPTIFEPLFLRHQPRLFERLTLGACLLSYVQKKENSPTVLIMQATIAIIGRRVSSPLVNKFNIIKSAVQEDSVTLKMDFG